MGRPTKLTDKIKPIIELLARKGFTDKEISKVIGITDRTLDNWKRADKDFFRSLKDGKNIALKDVKRSLYERAVGYSHPDIHISTYQGKVKETPITKHYPPDVEAAKFILVNRDPENWSNKQTVDIPELSNIADRIISSRKGSGGQDRT